MKTEDIRSHLMFPSVYEWMCKVHPFTNDLIKHTMSHIPLLLLKAMEDDLISRSRKDVDIIKHEIVESLIDKVMDDRIIIDSVSHINISENDGVFRIAFNFKDGYKYQERFIKRSDIEKNSKADKMKSSNDQRIICPYSIGSGNLIYCSNGYITNDTTALGKCRAWKEEETKWAYEDKYTTLPSHCSRLKNNHKRS